MGRLNSGEAATGDDANASAGLATSRFGDIGIETVESWVAIQQKTFQF